MTTGKGLRFAAATVSRRRTAVELVHDTLRMAILRGDLPGDTRLVQTEIATELGVSTTPVREAMRGLASEGLITLDNHRIGTVRRPDWDEMEEIVEIRRAIEQVAIARAITNITPQELDMARQLADELAKEEDLGSWVQRNIQFHEVFHRATNTSRLADILVSLERAGGVFVAQAQRLHPQIRKRAVADHYALLDAVTAEDVEKACEVQYDHIELPLKAFELEIDGN